MDDDGHLRFPDYAADELGYRSDVLDPFASFTIELYWQVLGQARLRNAFGLSFASDARVFVLGTGATPEVSRLTSW